MKGSTSLLIVSEQLMHAKKLLTMSVAPLAATPPTPHASTDTFVVRFLFCIELLVLSLNWLFLKYPYNG